mmetsp:Transcript_44019/g.127311  ORF Transcript_44019/g.127311 Transcript_44019/m.127311 type:complete len:254 (-) Transcript_44019:219-980(-)
MEHCVEPGVDLLQALTQLLRLVGGRELHGCSRGLFEHTREETGDHVQGGWQCLLQQPLDYRHHLLQVLMGWNAAALRRQDLPIRHEPLGILAVGEFHAAFGIVIPPLLGLGVKAPHPHHADRVVGGAPRIDVATLAKGVGLAHFEERLHGLLLVADHGQGGQGRHRRTARAARTQTAEVFLKLLHVPEAEPQLALECVGLVDVNILEQLDGVDALNNQFVDEVQEIGLVEKVPELLEGWAGQAGLGGFGHGRG